MEKVIDKCSKCGNKRVIVNKKYYLCDECNYFRLHGETKYDSFRRKQREQNKKRKHKKTGEWELFMEIWAEREHKCHNCGIRIFVPKPINFMHKKSKGASPSLRLKKSNIEIVCRDCHYAYDFQGMDKYNERKDLYDGA
jgi:DNA-directed RNA polymerase subunit RPC12/RpoP